MEKNELIAVDIDNSYRNWQIAEKAINEHGAIQKEQELEGFLNLLNNPKNILEIGYAAGGTHWAWKQICPNVLSIDIGKEGPGILKADSHDPRTLRLIMETYGRPAFDMVFIDGDHSYASVLLDYYTYRHFVHPGGIVGLHDICPTIYLDKDTGKPCNVEKAWRIIKRDAWDHYKEVKELMVDPTTWGGIGVVYQ